MQSACLISSDESVLKIRAETEQDQEGISNVIRLAFDNQPYSDKREVEIVDLLRKDSALIISLVAEIDNDIVGHISFSKVYINSEFSQWYGLAPVSVSPQEQGQGPRARVQVPAQHGRLLRGEARLRRGYRDL